MPTRRRSSLAAALTVALSVVVLGFGSANASTATSSSDPLDDTRERMAALSNLRGPAPVATTNQTGNPRIGHVNDPADDLAWLNYAADDTAPPTRYQRTVDITRFGYHYGQQTAKFTIRTRDLRSVKGGATLFGLTVITRSPGATDTFDIFVQGTRSSIETENGWTRPCAGRSVTRDTTRHTVTLRIPMRCLSGKASPTSMQASGGSALFAEDFAAGDDTPYHRRADLRR